MQTILPIEDLHDGIAQASSSNDDREVVQQRPRRRHGRARRPHVPVTFSTTTHRQGGTGDACSWRLRSDYSHSTFLTISRCFTNSQQVRFARLRIHAPSLLLDLTHTRAGCSSTQTSSRLQSRSSIHAHPHRLHDFAHSRSPSRMSRRAARSTPWSISPRSSLSIACSGSFPSERMRSRFVIPTARNAGAISDDRPCLWRNSSRGSRTDGVGRTVGVVFGGTLFSEGMGGEGRRRYG